MLRFSRVGRRHPFAVVLFAAATVLTLVTSPSALANPAGEIHYPDLQTIIPPNTFSIVQNGSTREFRYTHHVYNNGPGPLQIQPEYSEASGNYRGTQLIYTHNAAIQWSIARQVRVPDAFIFHAEHGHFHYPLASFGLYQVAANGGVGAPASLSPKNGFCIGDSFIVNTTVVHSGTNLGQGTCSDPTTMRGLSVGAVDEYDYRDPGQAIPINGLPDGTYWFKAISDPFNDIVEANEANNETDVKVTIANGTVTTGTSTTPDTTPPPVSITAPNDGAQVSGNVPITATSGVTGQDSVQLVVDGTPVGSSPDAASPFGFTWDSRTVVDGTHWLAMRATDAQGRINTSNVVAVNVANAAPPPPPPPGALAIDASVSKDGRTPVTAGPLTAATAGDVLLAFVTGDGPTGGGQQTATVSGGGLNWTLVKRANARPGTSEIWKATATGTVSAANITASLARTGFDESLTVTAFAHAAGVGASNAAWAASGAPSVSLTTTKAGSWVFGAGNDWDRAVARSIGPNQVMRHQWVDTAVGDTFWVQSQAAATANAGTSVPISDTAPTNGRWNLVSAEVLPGTPPSPPPPPPQDTSPPQVSINGPDDGATVTGITTIGVTAADNVGVTSVQVKVDGQAVGNALTAAPFMTQWDSRTASNGTHRITADARDAAGNVATSAEVTVTVDNTAPPPATISVDTSQFRQATGTLTTPAITTPSAGDLLVAFVTLDGPSGAASQRSTVTGAGLTWTLVKRSDSQAGAAEIWSAKATGTVSNATVTATPLRAGFDGMLHVVAFRNAASTGVAGASGAPTGAPDIYLPGIGAGSWVWAAGNDWDRAVARTQVSGQTVQRQWVDTRVGDTFWVQSTTALNTALGLVTIHDNAPTNDRWNYVAAEIKPAAGS